MEMMNVMYELATTKSALEMAETTIRKQRGKLLRKNKQIVQRLRDCSQLYPQRAGTE